MTDPELIDVLGPDTSSEQKQQRAEQLHLGEDQLMMEMIVLRDTIRELISELRSKW